MPSSVVGPARRNDDLAGEVVRLIDQRMHEIEPIAREYERLSLVSQMIGMKPEGIQATIGKKNQKPRQTKQTKLLSMIEEAGDEGLRIKVAAKKLHTPITYVYQMAANLMAEGHARRERGVLFLVR